MITRRHILKCFVFSAAALRFWPRLCEAGSASKKNRPQAFQWRVPKVHFDTVKKELGSKGKVTRDTDAKGGLVFVFVGAVLLPYLAKAVLALRREIVHGGVVIDTRGKVLDIKTDKSLPGGVIVVVTDKGTQIYERDEIENPSKLVGVLIKAK